jgi:hypothetical protein
VDLGDIQNLERDYPLAKGLKMLRIAFFLSSTALVCACVPPPAMAVMAPGAKTSVEKTTIVIKDPQGNVLRSEEKEMVIQEYTAREPVPLTTTRPPALQRFKVEKGRLVEVTQ